MGFETPITIEKVIQGIQENKYVLPAIQREFVWDGEQIEKLFDSLMRGYPIGSFLFWKIEPDHLSDFQFYRFMDHYHERDHRHNEPIDIVGGTSTTAVLDGQQRLTALNIGLKGWYANKLPYFRWNNDYAFPTRRLYLNLLNRPEDNGNAYDFKMLQEKETKPVAGKKFWFRVNDIFKFKELQDTMYFCIEQGLTADKRTFPSSALMELFRIIKEKPLVNYFQEESQDLDKVLNIFIRVNSGGTILSYSDMLLSIATAAWKKIDARKAIYDLVEDLNDIGERFQFNKDFLLKSCLVLSDIPAIEFRVSNFTRENMEKIEGNWEAITKALKETVKLISGWGYSWQTLVSNYAIIPLAYYIYKLETPTNFISSLKYTQDRELLRKWLQLALLKRTFSGQPDNVLRPIRKVILENPGGFPFNRILEELKATSKSMKFDSAELDGLLGYHYDQPYTFSVLSFLYPWLKYDQQFHVDHIFPRAMFSIKELRNHNIPQENWPLWMDHYNDLGNLQLLQGPVNIAKSDEPFDSWLTKECPSPDKLAVYKQLHLIPDGSLRFEDFPKVLEEREKIIRKKLAEALDVKLSEKE
jgi:uncharacterized protein with ParB-like and HNH nuclease domain